MNDTTSGRGRWGLVLAGGDGQRMRGFIESWLGEPRPKQYCAFTGRRSMLEHTLERALDAVAPERLVTVIGADHRRWLDRPLPGRVLEQPGNFGTGPGILFGLAHILAEEPGATVAVLPSDHFIAPRFAFRARLLEAFELAEASPGTLTLLCARPDRAETDYGWVEPGGPAPGRAGARLARRFVEKPAEAEALRLLGAGALWNTLILAARADALWTAAWAAAPDLAGRFQALRAFIGTPRYASVLRGVYETLSPADFSRAVLERSTDRLIALALDGVSWCDWGRPGRVVRTLEGLGLRPSFPLEQPAAA